MNPEVTRKRKPPKRRAKAVRDRLGQCLANMDKGCSLAKFRSCSAEEGNVGKLRMLGSQVPREDANRSRRDDEICESEAVDAGCRSSCSIARTLRFICAHVSLGPNSHHGDSCILIPPAGIRKIAEASCEGRTTCDAQGCAI